MEGSTYLPTTVAKIDVIRQGTRCIIYFVGQPSYRYTYMIIINIYIIIITLLYYRILRDQILNLVSVLLFPRNNNMSDDDKKGFTHALRSGLFF